MTKISKHDKNTIKLHVMLLIWDAQHLVGNL